MNMTLLAVGKAKQGALTELLASYLKRLPWKFQIKEVEEKRKLPPLPA